MGSWTIVLLVASNDIIIKYLTINSKSILKQHLPYEFVMISDEEEVNVACTVVTSVIVHYN